MSSENIATVPSSSGPVVPVLSVKRDNKEIIVNSDGSMIDKNNVSNGEKTSQKEVSDGATNSPFSIF